MEIVRDETAASEPAFALPGLFREHMAGPYRMM
jgi:hypothetical protein